MLQDCRNKVLCDYLKQAAGFAKASTILCHKNKIFRKILRAFPKKVKVKVPKKLNVFRK